MSQSTQRFENYNTFLKMEIGSERLSRAFDVKCVFFCQVKKHSVKSQASIVCTAAWSDLYGLFRKRGSSWSSLCASLWVFD